MFSTWSKQCRSWIGLLRHSGRIRTLLLTWAVNERPSHKNRLRVGLQLATPSRIIDLSPSLLAHRRRTWIGHLVVKCHLHLGMCTPKPSLRKDYSGSPFWAVLPLSPPQYPLSTGTCKTRRAHAHGLLRSQHGQLRPMSSRVRPSCGCVDGLHPLSLASSSPLSGGVAAAWVQPAASPRRA